ncbi:MAG TPA: hypothetical protein VFN74_24870 [Chloroflexota bacterium]|nr:hypothetical protein [Chloroflexota bacterium]
MTLAAPPSPPTPPTAEASTASLGAAVTAADFIARPGRHSADAPVVTSRGYISGALFPSVEDLARALRALRGAGRTEDVVGLLIPLDGDDPAAGIARARREPAPRRGFSLGEFLMTALDPHRQTTWTAGWAPGKNSGAAVELLGDVTRWLVGIQAVRLHGIPGEEPLWVLGRPNHAAAIHKLEGDSQEGLVGMLATYAIAESIAPYVAERLSAGDCVLTTCESDANRARNDERIMKKAGAVRVFDLLPLTWQYGHRQA